MPVAANWKCATCLPPEPAKFRTGSERHGCAQWPSRYQRRPTPGTLVTLKFGPSAKGPGLVREISILAEPGGQFTYLPDGFLISTCTPGCWSWSILAIPKVTTFTSIPLWLAWDSLHEGANVTVTTSFDGANYTASSVAVNSTPVQ